LPKAATVVQAPFLFIRCAGPLEKGVCGEMNRINAIRLTTPHRWWKMRRIGPSRSNSLAFRRNFGVNQNNRR
jgi:hypothetical protein